MPLPMLRSILFNPDRAIDMTPGATFHARENE